MELGGSFVILLFGEVLARTKNSDYTQNTGKNQYYLENDIQVT
jgi:hypothetical protein